MTEALLRYDELKIRIEPAGEPDAYRVLVVAPDGSSASEQFSRPFSDTDLDRFVQKVGIPRAQSRSFRSAAMEEAKTLGGSLFGAVFRGETRDIYATARGVAESRDRGLRVTLCLTSVPELMGDPWEYLYERPGFLSQSVRTPVVRSLDLPTARAAHRVTPPLRILGIVSSPRGLPQLDVTAEKEKLDSALRGLVEAGVVELTWLPRATMAELDRYISAPDEVHVIHYIGHGAYDEATRHGILVFEDKDGLQDEVTGEEFSSMLVDERSLRLVVLNACEGARTSHVDPFSGVASSILESGIPAVIGMQFEVTDEAAICFADRFYTSLSRGYPIDAALAQSRRAIFAGGNETEFGSPVLFLRGENTRLFDVAPTQVPAEAKAVASARPELRTAQGEPEAERSSAGRSEIQTPRAPGNVPVIPIAGAAATRAQGPAATQPPAATQVPLATAFAPPVAPPVPPRPVRRSAMLVGAGVGLVAVVAAGAFALSGIGPAPLTPSATTASPATPVTSVDSVTATPSLPGPTGGTWSSLGSLSENALGDTTYQLPNGKVIVFSTCVGTVPSRNSWWVDPTNGATQSGPAMTASQRIPATAVMDDGSLLVAGGWLGLDPQSAVEILDASTMQWRAAAPMQMPRSQATITNLGRGHFLVAGGWIKHNGDGGWSATQTAEIYDAASNSWSSTASMSTPRALATATRLSGGRVLVSGGDQAWVGKTGESVLASAEIFDSASGSWQSAGSMSSVRSAHFAARLPDGRVLVAGGWSDGRERGMKSTDIYDPTSGGWSAGPDMPGSRAQGRVALLSDGSFLLVGGVDEKALAMASFVRFDPSQGAWGATSSLPAAVYWPGAVPLRDGRVLVVGGATDGGANGRLWLLTF